MSPERLLLSFLTGASQHPPPAPSGQAGDSSFSPRRCVMKSALVLDMEHAKLGYVNEVYFEST